MSGLQWELQIQLAVGVAEKRKKRKNEEYIIDLCTGVKRIMERALFLPYIILS